MVEKTKSRKRYELFIKANSLFENSDDSSKNISSNDIQLKENARRFAMLEAAKYLPEFREIMEREDLQEEFLRNPVKVERVLVNSLMKYAKLTKRIFERNYKSIIKEAPDKGLAKILYETPQFEIEGDESYNKVAYSHKRFIELSDLIGRYHDENNPQIKQPKHEDFYKAIEKDVESEIIKNFAEDPELRYEKELLADTISVAKFILAGSPQLCILTTSNSANRYKKKIDEYLPGESDKAYHVRKTLTRLAKDEKTIPQAINFSYMASKAA